MIKHFNTTVGWLRFNWITLGFLAGIIATRAYAAEMRPLTESLSFGDFSIAVFEKFHITVCSEDFSTASTGAVSSALFPLSIITNESVVGMVNEVQSVIPFIHSRLVGSNVIVLTATNCIKINNPMETIVRPFRASGDLDYILAIIQKNASGFSPIRIQGQKRQSPQLQLEFKTAATVRQVLEAISQQSSVSWNVALAEYSLDTNASHRLVWSFYWRP